MSLSGVAAKAHATIRQLRAEQRTCTAGNSHDSVAAPGRSAVSSPSTTPVADGAVAIASMTSCTNTSDPYVMTATGLLARNASGYGLKPKPWVRTSLAPGSRTVTDYLAAAELSEPLDALGLHLVGYGRMTCIGNSGSLLPQAAAAAEEDVLLASVLSGNRNVDGRINNQISLNYLPPPLRSSWLTRSLVPSPTTYRRNLRATTRRGVRSCSPTCG